MGLIRVEIEGSFNQYPGLEPPSRVEFSAQAHGHAQAVSDAIAFLAEQVMPKAIANDHRLQATAQYPLTGSFGKVEHP